MAKRFRFDHPFEKPAARLLLLLVFCCAVSFAPAMGQDALGELELLKGQVKVRHLNKSSVFSVVGERVPVFLGDVVQTARDSRAKLSFDAENETVSLYANTHFVVKIVTRSRSSFLLNVGKAIFGVFRQKKFTVRTSTATIGVKGTEFVAATDGQQTFLLTLTGVVGIVSVAFPEIEVVTEANQATVVRANQPPTPPVIVAPEVREKVIQEEGLEPFEALEIEAPAVEAAPVEAAEEVQEIIEAVQETIETSTETARPPAGGSVKYTIQNP